MRFLLLWVIRMYWKLPLRCHDCCIFKESCSHYVYRITRQQGFLAGLQALKERVHECKPGYVLYQYDGKVYMKLSNGKLIDEELIAPQLITSEPILNLDDPSSITNLYSPSNKYQ